MSVTFVYVGVQDREVLFKVEKSALRFETGVVVAIPAPPTSSDVITSR